MVQDILASLLSKITGRQQKRCRGYREVIEEICNGKEPDAAAAERILIEAGKTPVQLQEDVALAMRRRQLAETTRADEGCAEERSKLNAKRQKTAATFDAARLEYEAAMEALDAQEGSVLRREESAATARLELRKTASDELKVQIADVCRRRGDLVRRRQIVHESNNAIRLQGETAARRLSLTGAPELVSAYSAEVARVERGMAANTEAVAALERQIADLNREEELLVQATLAP